MAEVATLKVPARRIEAFQLAVLDEIATDAEASNSRIGTGVDDYRSSVSMLQADLEVFGQVGGEASGDAVEVRSDADTLAHTVETMARKILGPKIAEELYTSPIDGERAVELHQLAEDLAWAIDSARLLHEQAGAERAARVEVA